MNPYPITLLYDGACPVCIHEMTRLSRFDRKRRLRFVDISADDFDETRHAATRDEMMTLMHAELPDGRMLKGVDALSAAYAAVGLGWLWVPLRTRLLRPYADALYARLARHRMRISRALGVGCADDRCRVPK
jgi:predicted DCC family thiol-disulfide oxidoreductase YuxK